MKAILGLKQKANAIAKDRLEQARSGKGPVDLSSLKPFEEASQKALGLEYTEPASSQRSSRAPSPSKRPPQTTQGKQDIDPVLESLLQSERREAVKEEFLKEIPDAYTSTHHLNIKAATYNVNGRRPPSTLDLSPWIDLVGHPADVVAIGFQEVVPLTAQNIMLGASQEQSAEWEKLIDVCLNGLGDREEGHLLPKPSPLDSQSTPSPSRKQLIEVNASPTKDTLSQSSLPEREVPDLSDVGELKSPRSTETGTGETDELEGYLSPAEDTISMLSDDHIAPRSYIQVVGKQMVGVYLTVWVKRSLLKHIRGVQTITVGTGMMGYLGNKGAVMARMRIFDSGISFVSSHLSSGEQEGDEVKRNNDYADIVRRASFPTDAETMEPESLSQKTSNAGNDTQGQLGARATGQWGTQQGLLETSHLVWMGDLNYRLNAPDAEARSLVKSGDWAALAAKDQLSIARKDRKAFQGWDEGPLLFPPTFKFKRGTSTYLGANDEDQDATEPSSVSAATGTTPGAGLERGQGQKQEPEKKRTPAWTDRILWHTRGGLRQTTYSSANLFVSDHKPVVANFSFIAREYDRSKVQQILEAAKNAVHEREAASVPRCELEPHTIEAGSIFYAKEKVIPTVLRNRGQVPASWRFVPISGFVAESGGDQEQRIAPKWAKIQPESGSLAPGEAVEIRITIWVDGGRDGSADFLVSRMKSKLDAIVLLRVEGGNDVFCSIIGQLVPSYLGLSPTTLSSMPRPLDSATGWESGSPKLRINTQKKAKRRQPSEGGAADFYSPMADLSEQAFETAEAPEGPIHEQAEAVQTQNHTEGSASGPLGSQDQSSSPLHADAGGDIAVDQLFEAFGLKQSEARNGQPAASSNRQSDEEQEMVPLELIAMTDYLQGSPLRRLFLESSYRAEAWQPQTPRTFQLLQERRRSFLDVHKVRRSLDQSGAIPQDASHQDVAAAVLCFFLALPEPFFPVETISGSHPVPNRQAAMERLATFVPPADLAVARHILGFLRQGLDVDSGPDAASKQRLAELFTCVWFDRMVQAQSEERNAPHNNMNSKIDFVAVLLGN